MESIAFANVLLLGGGLMVLLGIVSSLIATRFGAPLLLVFLVLGMLAGENGPGHIAFNDYRLTYIVGSLALAVILFDGGLRTHLPRLRGAIGPATVLATFGVVATTVLAGAAASLIFRIPPLQGLLLGSIVASTDAAAVFFLLHAGGLQLRQRVGATIEIESAANDPIAVFLTVMLVEIILGQGGTATGWSAAGGILGHLAIEAGVGVLGGLMGGFAASWALNRMALPSGLHPLLVIATAVVIYALTAILHGSGFLAVYLAGLILGNRPLRAAASIVTVNDTATWLCQIAMFLLLGLLVTPSHLWQVAVPAVTLAAALILVARPVAVWLSLSPFGFSWREKTFISWVGLRGAVSIFLAAIPTLAGVTGADLYFNVAFVVVLVSLVIQGWSMTPTARRLGIALPRVSVPVRRVELDLPGQLELEMVGYPVTADSAVVNGAIVPQWARPAFVIRDQSIVMPSEARPLRVGDHAYFLVPPRRAAQLDALFAAHTELLTTDEPFFGEFDFDGTIKLREVAAFYGLALDGELVELTIAALFAARFDDTPEVGDHLPVGTATLVAREVVDGHVTRAGLQLAALIDDPVKSALDSGFGRLKRLAVRLLP
ncbi:MAG: potassium/proton antiporter [Rhodospirillaceae bacterium]|nr:MAG: potassium/proton antiporter [Rhodospirillaceae bacterium]